eukprot:5247-Heterococcus_DN1.PRE.5
MLVHAQRSWSLRPYIFSREKKDTSIVHHIEYAQRFWFSTTATYLLPIQIIAVRVIHATAAAATAASIVHAIHR